MEFDIDSKLKKSSGIYKIINILNDKIYIGSTESFKIRFNKHIGALRNKRHHSPHLQNFYNKYGEGCLKFQIVEIVDESKLIEREQYYLDTLKPFGENGFNCSPTAGSVRGFKRGEEYSAKVSILRGKSIASFDKDGNLVKSYPSHFFAKKDGFNANCINRVLNGERGTYRNLWWKCIDEEEGGISLPLDFKDNFNRVRRRRVGMFSKEGELIEEFESIKDACEKYGLSEVSVRSACGGFIKYFNDCSWRFISGETRRSVMKGKKRTLEVREKIRESHRRYVYQLDENGLIFDIYKGTCEAAKLNNFNRDNINTACRKNIPYKGFFWKKGAKVI